MAIDLKQAEKLWKAVKPMTLTKTGVSESLGVLKTYERKLVTETTAQDWGKKFAALASKMKKHVGDDKIKKHAKAHKWLVDLDFQLATEGQFISKFIEHGKLQQEKEEKARKDEAEKQRQELKVAAENKQWSESLAKSLKTLTSIKSEYAEQINGTKQMIQQVEDGNYSEQMDTTQVMILETEFDDLKGRREKAEKIWSPIIKAINSSTTATPKVLQAASGVEKLDKELRPDANGLEKVAGDLLEHLGKAIKNFEEQSKSQYGMMLATYKKAEGQLTRLHQEADQLLEFTLSLTKEVASGKTLPVVAASTARLYQKDLEKLTQQRQALKPSWFDVRGTAQALAKTSPDKALEKALEKVTSLDAGLRAQDGGKEGTIAKKLVPLLNPKSGNGPRSQSKPSGGSTGESKGGTTANSGRKTPSAKDCETLGLKWPCTLEEAKKAYRTLALKWHPDKWAGKPQTEQDVATEKFKLIGNAYEVFTKYFE